MIYLVEDEPGIRDLVIYTLNNSGFDARGFSNGTDFWAVLGKNPRDMPEMVLLDIMLPGEDGLAVLKRLRSSQATKQLPVIMLSARGTEYDKVLGLDSGADDYLAKPFGMMELLARVKSLLRRSQKDGSQGEYRVGSLFVSIPRHTVSAGNEELNLTVKEFKLLVYMLENKDIVLSRERILQAVWGYEFPGETRTVDTHILTLRTKLKTAGGLIQTVRGLGYKLGESL